MVKPFSDAIKDMESGKYTKQPVHTQFGWHVILLEESRETPPPTLEQVKSEIVNKLQQKALADYMQKLRADSTLQFNEKAGLKKKEPAQTDS
jgi:peptidyl-prolyl cis-trans isomerase C